MSEELAAQVDDALSDARVPRYVKQLIKILYRNVVEDPEQWINVSESGTTVASPSIRCLQSQRKDETNSSKVRRPNLSTLPNIPFNPKNRSLHVNKLGNMRIDASELPSNFQPDFTLDDVDYEYLQRREMRQSHERQALERQQVFERQRIADKQQIFDTQQKLIDNQQALENQTIGKQTLDRHTKERQNLERLALERQILERHALERQALERQVLERQAMERQALERQALERQALERQALEPQSIGRHAAELDLKQLDPSNFEKYAIERQKLDRSRELVSKKVYDRNGVELDDKVTGEGSMFDRGLGRRSGIGSNMPGSCTRIASPTNNVYGGSSSVSRLMSRNTSCDRMFHDGATLGPGDEGSVMDSEAVAKRRNGRNVVFSLRIDSVGAAGCREIDVFSITPTEKRVLLASRIVTLAEVQDLKVLADFIGYEDFKPYGKSLPYGQILSGHALCCSLTPDRDVNLGRICRRLAAVAAAEVSNIQHLFMCKVVLGSRIRWVGSGIRKLVYVFLNEGEGGVLSLPDVGVKIRPQKGTAVCIHKEDQDLKGLEKSTGGIFPDGEKLLLIATF